MFTQTDILKSVLYALAKMDDAKSSLYNIQYYISSGAITNEQIDSNLDRARQKLDDALHEVESTIISTDETRIKKLGEL